MKKLSLNIDELKVDSFTIDRDGDGQGTVRGHNHIYTDIHDTRCCTHVMTCGDGSQCEYDTLEYPCATEDPHRCPGPATSSVSV